MKILVAIFAVLLALVAPAAAQEPDADPSSSGSEATEPSPSSSDAAQEPSSNASAGASGDQPEPAAAKSSNGPVRTCPIVESNVGDPRIPKSQWVIVDPHGCLQQVVARVIGQLPPRLRPR